MENYEYPDSNSNDSLQFYPLYTASERPLSAVAHA
jgi:hypothetical protein